MVTPGHLLIAFRLAFASGAGLLAVLILGPFQGLERSFGMTDTVAHALAFYLATLGLFLVAPMRRRDDLALFVIATALAIEIIQPFVGRSMALSDFLAGVGGVMAAYAPGRVEQFRQAVRRHPDSSFSEILALDRRKSSLGDAPAPAATPSGGDQNPA